MKYPKQNARCKMTEIESLPKFYFSNSIFKNYELQMTFALWQIVAVALVFLIGEINQ